MLHYALSKHEKNKMASTNKFFGNFHDKNSITLTKKFFGKRK